MYSRRVTESFTRRVALIMWVFAASGSFDNVKLFLREPLGG